MAEVRKRYLCGHCNEFVCKTIYHKHKQLYYNKEAKKWCTERVVDLTSEEFSFEDDDPGTWTVACLIIFKRFC